MPEFHEDETNCRTPASPRETQTQLALSWERAQKEAVRWVDSLNIPTRSLQGKTVDLTAQAAKLTFEPKFRAMVIRAARRLLKTRGVEAIIPAP